MRHASICSRARSIDSNSFTFRHSSRNLPLKDSHKPLSVGFPGRVKSSCTPWNRVEVYLSLCACPNHIRRFKRPEYIAHRDFTLIVTLPDDCLLRHYDVELPWRDGMPESAYKTALEAA
jgi:hypothetical protein